MMRFFVAAFFMTACLFCSCKSSLHDDARELADKKCDLMWTTEEYQRVQTEYMNQMRAGNSGSFDTARARSAEMNSVDRLEREKELSGKLQSLTDKINDLNKDIDRLNEKFYGKYDDKDMATLTRDAKSLAARCKP